MKKIYIAFSSLMFVSMLVNGQNVGIGTTSPASRLEIKGVTSDSTTSSLHVTNASGTTLMYIGNHGKTGIGIATPQASLDVMGDFRITSPMSGSVGFTAAPFSSGTVYTLPFADGTFGQVLTTDGIGNLSWVDPAGLPGPQGPQGPPGASGSTINCSTSFNTNYTIRGNGNDTWECTNDLQVSSTGYVSINTTPSSSYRLRVNGNVGIGTSPSSSFDLSVNGDGHMSGALSVGTTISAPTGGILASGDIKTNNDMFASGSLSVGTSSMAPSGGILSSGDIKTNSNVIVPSTSGSGTAVVRTSSGQLRPQSSTIRVKENIRDLNIDKEKFLSIRPVSFNLKKALGGDPDIGVIAEEVEKLVPDLVIYGPKRNWIGDSGLTQRDETGSEILSTTESEPYSVRYDKIGIYLLKIVADQEKTIQQLQSEVAALKNTMERAEIRSSK
jgi:hypothetical protein